MERWCLGRWQSDGGVVTIPGKGSAIFLHLAHEDFRPTAGCIAVSFETMRHLLPRLTRDTLIEIR